MAEKLDKPKITLRDGATAELLAFGSAVASLLPASMNFIGRSDAPSYVPVRWRHLRQSAGSVGGQWVRYRGIDTAGHTPRNYAAAAIILVDRESMHVALNEHDGEGVYPALAYRLGSTVMAGVSKESSILGLEHPDDDDYKVAMRIGNGPLDAQVAVETQYSGRERLYLPLEQGVRPGPIVPISEVPSTIPLV